MEDGSYDPKAVKALWVSSPGGATCLERYFEDDVRVDDSAVFTGAVYSFQTLFAQLGLNGKFEEMVIGGTRFLVRERGELTGILAIESSAPTAVFEERMYRVLDYVESEYQELIGNGGGIKRESRLYAEVGRIMEKDAVSSSQPQKSKLSFDMDDLKSFVRNLSKKKNSTE